MRTHLGHRAGLVFLIVALGILGASGAAQAQNQSFHEATETDRGVDAESGEKVKLTSKRHVNICLDREPDQKLIDKQRLYLVIDTATENLCSQFYVFKTKGAVENLGACSYAFPLAPEETSVQTKKNKGVSLTQVIVDNRAIMNPDPEATVGVTPTIYGTLDWVVDAKEKKGGPGKFKGPSYGTLSVAGEGGFDALINDGEIDAKSPDDLALAEFGIDCACGNGVVDVDDGEECDATADDSDCGGNQICNASCSVCLDLCRNSVLDETEVCDQTAPFNGCAQGERCIMDCGVCEVPP
jgi:hypothetical protein